MKRIAFFLLLFIGFKSYAQPNLVVGIVVDQMRYDYLQRYQARFCDSGFKRLMGEGFVYANAHYNYVPTQTGPGHASIYTGTTPAYHGIVANDWYDRSRGDMMYCAEDTLVNIIGGKGKGMSPKNMLATTVTDQLVLAYGRKSRVIGLSIKDRGAILPAGHAGKGAFWYDSKSGKLQSSDWYGEKLPEWVEAFNKRGLALKYLDQTWNTLYPLSSYYETSWTDDNPYEGGLIKGQPAVFPYDLKEIQKNRGYGLLSFTPFGNSFLTDAALAAIAGEQLGADGRKDFLCISYSCTDYAGHLFGPQSIEVEDMYLRLDREIARLLHTLDQKLGKGNYTVFLTADHGANEVPALLGDMGIRAGIYNNDSMAKRIEAAMIAELGENLLLGVYNEQVYLNTERIHQKAIQMEWVESIVQRALAGSDGVCRVWTKSEINSSLDEYAVLIRNGYHPLRSGDLFIQTLPGWMEYWQQGTTHGSGYSYDTHIPILFYGYGVQNGLSSRKVAITDIAPSLSLILGIQQPNACTGLPLQEMLGY